MHEPILVLFDLASSKPQSQDLQKSINAVLKSLEVKEPQRERENIRSKIITKYDFMKTRDKKSTLNLPEEFVVSTNLFVNHGDSAQVRLLAIKKFPIIWIHLSTLTIFHRE